jgi:hypothetical protein
MLPQEFAGTPKKRNVPFFFSGRDFRMLDLSSKIIDKTGEE